MTSFHIMAGAAGTVARPQVRQIGLADLVDSLRRGLDDFWAKPSHLLFLGLIYPIVGLVLARWTSQAGALQLIYPLMSGFALIGPFAAIGLYEISRRREAGLDFSWRHALGVRNSPAAPAILVVGALLAVLFLTWLGVAHALYAASFGDAGPATLTGFLREALTAERGWRLVLLGNAAGFVFAAIVLMTTVIAFPLLLDRDVGAIAAIETSIRAVAASPLTMAAWGLIVAALLVLGALPVFAGLAVVVPVLGHATWHLYRKAVIREEDRPPPV
jgi:uncharacterized membrane protein